MKKNVGNIDRIIRILLGIGFLSLIFILDGNLRWVGLLGLVLIGTGLINFCPLYLPFGISTRGRK